MKSSSELIVAFFKTTQPVQWLHWLGKIGDESSRKELELILYDEENRLRDLTKKTIRKKVLEKILNSPSWNAFIEKEMECFIDQATRKIQGKI